MANTPLRRLRTEVMSRILRTYVALEANWNRLVATLTAPELGALIGAGVALTFVPFLAPFAVASLALSNGLQPLRRSTR